MGNILYFLARYNRIFIFVLLEITALSLVVSYHDAKRKTVFSFLNDITSRFDSKVSDIKYYFHLKSTNESLLAENARLRQNQPNAKWADTMRQVQIIDTTFKQKFTYQPAQVINNSTNVKNNYITIDAGTNKGVNSHMGVVSTNGIIGITRFSSGNYATVLSVLHKDFQVSAQILENDELGSVVWEGGSPDVVTLKDIPVHIILKKGWHVIVSQNSDAFPKGIPIGTIISFQTNGSEATYNVKVRLAASIRNVQKVYVINNILLDEKKALETKTLESNK